MRLLAEGVRDAGKLMLELKVGPRRLARILRSPTVKRWRACVELVREELEDVPGALSEASGGEAPDQVRQSIAGILQGVVDGRWGADEAQGVLWWALKALRARLACRGRSLEERADLAEEDPDVREVLTFLPGLLVEPLPLG